jgi:integrase
MGVKVTLRRKPISEQRESLYLDFYPAIPHPKTGKETRREFLKMYVYTDKDEIKKEIQEREKARQNIEALKSLYKTLKPLSPIDKMHNLETQKIADSIRQKRENELNKPEIYSDFEKEQLRLKKMGEQNFIDYFQVLADKRNDSNRSNWISTLHYLKDFTGNELKFADLNEKIFNDFKEYLLTVKSKRSDKLVLSRNSAVSYFNKIKAALKQAYKDGILQTDLNVKLEPIKAKETRRDYLTLEELNTLIKTPCNDSLLKRAALFSALTGLAFADIQKMTWSELEYIEGEGYILKYTRKKTDNPDDLPISEQAYNLLGERGQAHKKVFDGLKYSAYSNRSLYQWIGAAGITKNISFHNFRHTFAVLQLANGTDITTVQKMLNHKNLKTTMIYAKVVDRAKREAADKIKLDLK